MYMFTWNLLFTVFKPNVYICCSYHACRILSECRSELGLEGDVSSDEEALPNLTATEGKDEPITEEEYHRMLRKHHRRRLLKRVRRGGEGRGRERGMVGEGKERRREGEGGGEREGGREGDSKQRKEDQVKWIWELETLESQKGPQTTPTCIADGETIWLWENDLGDCNRELIHHNYTA